MLITHYQFMKSFLVRLSLAALLAFCLLAAVGVKAERPAGSQETAVIPQSTSGQLAAEARDTKETPGATQEMPSAFDLLLKKVKQNIELIFTLDPVADAKKRVEFATENFVLAADMLASGDDAAKERAAELMERADRLIQDVTAAKDKITKETPEKIAQLRGLVEDHLGKRQSASSGEGVPPAPGELLEALGDLVGMEKVEVPAVIAPVKLLPEQIIQLLRADQDRDGIPNDDEKQLGTSNVDFDTDGDGIGDKTEIETYKTDPGNPDTDGDGFWDGLELLKGYDPKGPGKLSG